MDCRSGDLTSEREGVQTQSAMRLAYLSLLAVVSLPVVSRAQAPTFKITTADSTIKFSVKASLLMARSTSGTRR